MDFVTQIGLTQTTVISDARRYENGWDLCQEIQNEKRYKAEIDYMITRLPSYTQLGMAGLIEYARSI